MTWIAGVALEWTILACEMWATFVHPTPGGYVCTGVATTCAVMMTGFAFAVWRKNRHGRDTR